MSGSILNLIYVFAQSLAGTTMVPLGLDDLTQKADLIVDVTIQEKTSYWQGQRIYSRSHAKINEIIKESLNQPQAYIDILSMGGVVGHIGQKVHGAPVLEQGKQYMLFLVEPEPGKYFVYGMEQGVIAASTDFNGVQMGIPLHHLNPTNTPTPLVTLKEEIFRLSHAKHHP
jgi:hypothetical protein